MNKQTIDDLGINGCDVIRAMFNMADDRNLYISDRHAASECEDPVKTVQYYVDFFGATPEKEIAMFEYFRKTIQEISGYTGKDRRIPVETLPAPLAAFASVFLLPAEADYSDEEIESIREDLDLLEKGDRLEAGRIRELKHYLEVVERDAARRVGSGPLAHMLVRRCQRLLMLYMLEAPEVILKKEEKLLAFTMIVHYRGEIVASDWTSN